MCWSWSPNNKKGPAKGLSYPSFGGRSRAQKNCSITVIRRWYSSSLSRFRHWRSRARSKSVTRPSSSWSALTSKPSASLARLSARTFFPPVSTEAKNCRERPQRSAAFSAGGYATMGLGRRSISWSPGEGCGCPSPCCGPGGFSRGGVWRWGRCAPSR